MDVRGTTFYLFMFCYYFLVFLFFTTYEFWFVFCMECQRPNQELVMELCFQDFFFIVKMKMRLRDWQCTWWWTGINTRRQKKLSTLGCKLIFLDFMFLVLPLWVLGKMFKLNYVDVLHFCFINFVVLRFEGRTLYVDESIET